MLDDLDLWATCIADEAAAEPYEGKVAVAIAIYNRMALKYASDGTVRGTVLKPNQFSGFWFAMEHGEYTRIVASADFSGAMNEAETLYNEFSKQSIWADCLRAPADAKAWALGHALSFVPGPAFAGIGPNTVLYYNPRICAAPAWAIPSKQAAVIFRHTFYNR